MVRRPALPTGVGAGAAFVALFWVVVGVAACSSTSATRGDLVESFRNTNPDASTAQAECVVDELIAEYSLEGLERELEAVPKASSFERGQFLASFGCGLTSDVEAELADQLQASGIAADDADCAAEALTEGLDDEDLAVLLSGEITDQFYAKYFVALDECDALPK
ncbi:MAG: hypothetical protein ACI8TP_002567 [Acidimicrobiales bacterium]